jgi:predicted negative regulator of RcsB-dependent stress response
MAIDDLLDEHEQSEKVRTWLKENALGLIGGIALGLALIGGWQWWQKQQERARLDTAARYQSVADDIQSVKLKQAQAGIVAIDDGAYVTLAAMQLSKAQLAAGQRDAAIATLRGAHPSDPALASIATQRLARLLIDAGKAAEALRLLPGDSTDAEMLQVRGDAQFALGHRDEARATYQQALTRLDVGAPQRRLVELKLIQVGGTPPTPEAKS